MRFPKPRRADVFAAAMSALWLLHPLAASAACNPESCDAVFACGTRECIGNSCVTFAETSGTVCRAAAGVCDRAETCNGSSISCPSDQKTSASTVCRSSADACDAAEMCTGTSAFCPADVSITPSIDRLILLERRSHFPSGFGNHSLAVELEGTNLCLVSLQSTEAIPSPIEFGTNTPSDRVQQNLLLNSSPLPNDTYTFAVNRGAAGGTLEFGAGTPNGSIVALSPAHTERVGPNPEFRILSDCSTCGLIRVLLSDDDPFLPFAETPDGFAPPPLDVEVALELGDLIGAPAQLAEAEYQLTIEAIAGTLGFDHAFEGDSSGVRFTYLAGTSETNVIEFSVPEPGANPCAWGAALALGIRAHARRRRIA